MTNSPLYLVLSIAVIQVAAISSSLALVRPQNMEYTQAQALIKLMHREGRCQVPQRRVVEVSSVALNGLKKYQPPAVFLHVCDNQTGCCFNQQETCQPKSMEKVEFYFLTHEIVAGKPRNGIDKLSFFNHTECECQRIGAGIF